MFLLKSSRASLVIRSQCAFPTRTFIPSKAASAVQLPSRPVVKEEDLEEAFLKGSGPGGQKIVRHCSSWDFTPRP